MEEEQGGDKKPESPKPSEEEKSSSTEDSLKKIEEATERLENENRRLEENMAKMKLIEAERSIEGKSVANQEPEEISNSDYADAALRGEVIKDGGSKRT